MSTGKTSDTPRRRGRARGEDRRQIEESNHGDEAGPSAPAPATDLALAVNPTIPDRVLEYPYRPWGTRLEDLDGHFDAVTARLDTVTARLDTVTARLDTMQARLDIDFDGLAERQLQLENDAHRDNQDTLDTLREFRGRIATMNERTDAVFGAVGMVWLIAGVLMPAASWGVWNVFARWG